MDERTRADFDAAVEAGKKYEDFVMSVLWDNHIVCLPHRSRYYQWEFGENQQGIEIKEDRKFSTTGNLFVETRERRTTDESSSWRPCGIYDDPPPRLYCIGDYSTIYLLPVSVLRWMAEAGRFGHQVANGTGTAYGYLVPTVTATKFAVDIFTPNRAATVPANDDEIPF